MGEPENSSATQQEVGQPASGKLPFWRVMLSVTQAAFGVQKESNKQRDFSQASIVPYVVAALVFTALFVGCLVIVVKLVLST